MSQGIWGILCKGNLRLEGHAQLSIINTQNLPLVSRNSHLRPIDEDPHEPNDPAPCMPEIPYMSSVQIIGLAYAANLK